jgi:hypothetical protein
LTTLQFKQTNNREQIQTKQKMASVFIAGAAGLIGESIAIAFRNGKHINNLQVSVEFF